MKVVLCIKAKSDRPEVRSGSIATRSTDIECAIFFRSETGHAVIQVRSAALCQQETYSRLFAAIIMSGSVRPDRVWSLAALVWVPVLGIEHWRFRRRTLCSASL